MGYPLSSSRWSMSGFAMDECHVLDKLVSFS